MSAKMVQNKYGEFAITVSSEYDHLLAFSLCALKSKNTFYARFRSKGKIFALHRVIMEQHLGIKLTEKDIVDHIDGNGLNNVLTNLRVVSLAENNRHRPNAKKSKTNVVGVSKYKNKFYGRVRVNGKEYRSKGYASLAGAVKARERLLEKYSPS
jgi:hypothetical protein